MANRDLLADAIADAKAVKEVAIANAKAALEEAFTPHLKDMLAQKINEMDEIDEVEQISEESRKERAKVDKYEYEKGKLKGQNKFDKEVSTKIDETEEMDEGYGKKYMDEEKEMDEAHTKDHMDEEKEMDEELNLDELLAELELSEEKEMDEAKELDEEKEEMSEESRAERADVDKYEYEKGKDAGEDDDVDLDDMSEEDLKAMIEDVIEDMVNSGDLEAGGDAVELVDDEEEVEDVDVTVDVTDTEEIELEEDARTDAEEEGYKDGMKDAKADLSEISKELEEAKSVINHLRSELNEVNLLNSKLLYTNKIFKAKNLTESQKIKVLKALDRAETVKGAKAIFETLNENLVAKSTKSNIRESLGMASKPAGVAPKRPLNENVIQEDAMVARFKKLAGIN
tara:strand:- start:682 stop:1878 length:1197 start_codon:yes stop_codon:yes gene_type:complete